MPDAQRGWDPGGVRESGILSEEAQFSGGGEVRTDAQPVSGYERDLRRYDPAADEDRSQIDSGRDAQCGNHCELERTDRFPLH